MLTMSTTVAWPSHVTALDRDSSRPSGSSVLLDCFFRSRSPSSCAVSDHRSLQASSSTAPLRPTLTFLFTTPMKKLSVIVAYLAAFVVPVLAQRIWVDVPAEWTSVKPGSDLIVRVKRPDTLSSTDEVGVAIGFKPCGSIPCADFDVTQVLGSVAYNGPYDPKPYDSPNVPYENFTVTVPPYLQPPQQVSLNVAHFALVGVCVIILRHGIQM
ncbi:hypothetical protein L226DRAFT_321067 [Lentinus tigrinus ALCF2SS1-7]|uniref:uncharacterized protein n=1 Tax=Lentinus tigrinus ALCF2SS1-7 TaxID=1328758 RepID=UPI001165F99D|nr:hypothetical protein L226DRAFT_321067 [Lentinus tigrinus ALCF2SS1-7]